MDQPAIMSIFSNKVDCENVRIFFLVLPYFDHSNLRNLCSFLIEIQILQTKDLFTPARR